MSDDDWKMRAACRKVPTAVFFPAIFDEDTTDGDASVAKAVCDSCTVRSECEAEQKFEAWGIRFGTEPEDRGFRQGGDRKRYVYRGAKVAVIDAMRSEPGRIFWADSMVEHLHRKWPAGTISGVFVALRKEGKVFEYPSTPESGRQKRYQWKQEHQ